MTCPVLGNCYAQLSKHYYPAVRSDLLTASSFTSYDNALEDWNALGELIHRDSSPLSAQRLRAFYGLEVLYYYAVLSVEPMGKVRTILRDLQVQRTRDHAGLELFMASCRSVIKSLNAQLGNTELMGRERTPALDVVTASFRVAQRSVSGAHRLAEVLRTVLCGNDHELNTFGRILGEELAVNNTLLASSMIYLREMLSISLDNPVSPWNQSNSFQV